jgi:DNA-binding MarR family transcriptional regulator
MSSEDTNRNWHFLSNHTQVLLCIARDPDARIRDIAPAVGITERAAQRIVADLVAAGVVEREKVGRRNRYQLNLNAKMRHEAQSDQEVRQLLNLLETPDLEETG